MSRQTAKEVVILICTCCAVAYPFYAWTTGTGLYRWFVEFELTLQGNGPYAVYSMLVIIPVFVVTWGIFLAAYGATEWVISRLRLPPATMSEAPAAGNRTGQADVQRVQKIIVVFFLVSGVVSMVIAVRIAVVWYRKSNEVVTYEPLNLADGIPPRTTHVKLTGVAVPSLEMRYNDFVRSSHWEAYIPVLPPHWRQGDPVVYFLHPMHSDYLQHSGPVTIGQPGVLIRDGLPVPAAFLFKKHGIKLGTPPIVLETDREADLDPLLETAFWYAVFGLLVFGIFGSLTVSRLRERSRSRLAS